MAVNLGSLLQIYGVTAFKRERGHTSGYDDVTIVARAEPRFGPQTPEDRPALHKALHR